MENIKKETIIKLKYSNEIKQMDNRPNNFQDLQNFFLNKFKQNDHNKFKFYIINSKNNKEEIKEDEFFNDQIKEILNQKEPIIYVTLDNKSSIISIFNNSQNEYLNEKKHDSSQNNKTSKVFVNVKNAEKLTPQNSEKIIFQIPSNSIKDENKEQGLNENANNKKKNLLNNDNINKMINDENYYKKSNELKKKFYDFIEYNKKLYKEKNEQEKIIQNYKENKGQIKVQDDDKINKNEIEINDLKKELNIKNNEIEQLKNKIKNQIELENKLKLMNEQLENNENDIKNYKDELAKIKNDNFILIEKNKNLENQKKELEEYIKDNILYKKKSELFEKEIQELDKTLNSIENLNDDLSKSLNEKENILEEDQNLIQKLQNDLQTSNQIVKEEKEKQEKLINQIKEKDLEMQEN